MEEPATRAKGVQQWIRPRFHSIISRAESSCRNPRHFKAPITPAGSLNAPCGEALLRGYGVSGVSGVSGGYGVSGGSGVSGVSGVSGGYGGSGVSGGYGGSGGSGVSGVSGVSGGCGVSGVSGGYGGSGVYGVSGVSGVSGGCGVYGVSGGYGGKLLDNFTNVFFKCWVLLQLPASRQPHNFSCDTQRGAILCQRGLDLGAIETPWVVTGFGEFSQCFHGRCFLEVAERARLHRSQHAAARAPAHMSRAVLGFMLVFHFAPGGRSSVFIVVLWRAHHQPSDERDKHCRRDDDCQRADGQADVNLPVPSLDYLCWVHVLVVKFNSRR